ncbi:ABC transporter permease [Flammeovirga kamogawensis]|uniref:FtsX-like permease family protein n=1 Tax=Flammeovirga kamogawensis TaxID=373891 RepID=A0ABX8H2M4_9BACT|nr:FtsX-like permease family protein [Flammeovirga kamogawensis]MBB6464055.1 putative ABC transport system permease protein [Flammeovirga kamogawensis]QWG09869.1 FtsX-like permease family protein [Flammeovirga kamogawensis]TRX65375.1 ABC transporter permease [Flammeovirga kamogawensis]
MFEFLFKGLIRDKSRSLLPVIVVGLGVSLSVFFVGYMKGALGDVIEMNARFGTGHVKVMTREYIKNISQKPLDLSIYDASDVIADLEDKFPTMDWVKRVSFGGILDVPNEQGQTKTQGIAGGLAFDMSENSSDLKRMKLKESIKKGRLPNAPFEILLGEGLAKRMKVKLGDNITYFGTTMDGSMSFQNFKFVGTIGFGTSVLDDKTFIISLKDAEYILDMDDAAQEIFGFLPNDTYDEEKVQEVKTIYNASLKVNKDEFAPEMLALRDQNGLAYMLDMSASMSSIFTVFFIIAMSIVLWNTGLLGGLRRYTEFGIRIAIGESKKAIYKSLILEALVVGVIGSALGTLLGILCTYYLQEVGIDISSMMGQSNMIMSNIIRAQVVPQQLWIGFIPGVCATVLGALLSGRGIFKRQTSTLFNELGV